MPLEDRIDALTKALDANTAALNGIAGAAAARREPAPAAGAPADPPQTRRRRGAVTESTPATFLPPEPPDATVGSFKTYVQAWKEVGGQEGEAAEKERGARLTFIVDICNHLDIERVSECEPEERDIIVGLMKSFTKNPAVDYKKMLPLEAPATGGKRDVV